MNAHYLDARQAIAKSRDVDNARSRNDNAICENRRWSLNHAWFGYRPAWTKQKEIIAKCTTVDLEIRMLFHRHDKIDLHTITHLFTRAPETQKL